MVSEHEYVQILRELKEQFEPLFQKSQGGIHLYLHEVHKICNEKFAKMFSLTMKEWEEMDGFVNKHAVEKDQELIINNYHSHIHQSLTPARFQFTAIRKDRSKFKVETDMIPLPWRGEVLALHFFREV